MTKEDIILSLSAVKDEDIIFYNGGQKVSSIFNNSASKIHIDDSIENKLAILLFSYVEHLIIAKAMGKEASHNAYNQYQVHFSQIISNLTVEKDKAIKEKEDVLLTINHFLFDKENIDLALLLAKLSTMAVLKLAKKNDGLNSKVFQIFKKNKEQIFHQVVLFIRELFQSFLTVASIDPFLIANNILDLANPYFTYAKGLVIPVSADAFSSEQLKDMLKDIIFDLNDKFLDRDIDHIIVIYLLRGYVVRLNIK